MKISKSFSNFIIRFKLTAQMANGGILGGIVKVTQGGYGFFLSKNFIKTDAVSRIGMTEYVSLYPVSKLKNPELYGGFAYFVLTLYPEFMAQGTAKRHNLTEVQAIVQECSTTLAQIMNKYPGLQDVESFVR